jgi:putative holliday junction resolvase
MKLLGIDYGEKNIGLSICEFDMAQGFGEIYTNEAFLRISAICFQEKIEKIIIGLPEGRLKDKVKDFGQKLATTIKLPIVYWDETLTTNEAIKILISKKGQKKLRKKKEHQVAAGLILQSYIDNNL